MPTLICPSCGKKHTPDEWAKLFCTNSRCGARLTLNPAAIKPKVLKQKTKNAITRASFIQTSYLPEQFKASLAKVHVETSQLFPKYGFEPEPLQTALAVEEHRWFWKPKKVKFVLVAESHIKTTGKEVKALIDPSKLPKNMPSNSPLNFVRIVYCLAYGCSYLLEKPTLVENNWGTPDYINLLAELSDFQGKAIGLEGPVNILKKFKKDGFWLLDASVHACYLGSDERLEEKLVAEIIPRSWRNYICPIIEYTKVNPENVWIIGKLTHDLLRGKYIEANNWIYQPRAKVTDEQKDNRLKELKKAINLAI